MVGLFKSKAKPPTHHLQPPIATWKPKNLCSSSIKNVDGSEFVKKEKNKDDNNNKDKNSNSDNVTEALNNHSDNSVCSLV